MPLTREQSRAIDRLAIETYGIPGMVLMENAGRGVVDVLFEIDPTPNSRDAMSQMRLGVHRRIAILTGKGNNAGDGFVIARHLEIRGAAPRVLLLASPDELRGDARQNYEILCHTDVPLVDLSAAADLRAALEAEASDAEWLVDAMLGTGAIGPPREPFRTAIEWMNTHPARRLAIDVPSGLDCDTGQPSATTLRADHTCTFVASKVGFTAPSAAEYLGQLHVVSIGIPPRLVHEIASQ